jgi:hypothetical protein
MTTAQQGHLHRILRQTDALIASKYAKGAEEHGGLLSDKSPLELVDLAIEEATDQITYLLTLRERMVGLRMDNTLREVPVAGVEVVCT